MLKLKIWVKKILINIGIYTILILIIVWLYHSNQKNKEAYSIAESNYKTELLAKNGENRILQLTLDQFEYQQDSIMKKMDSVIQDNKIKAKTIQFLAYQKVEITKTDTIRLVDTVFQKGVNIDTTLIDPYYSLNLKLKYPSEIAVSPKFINENYIISHYKKETIKPKKCWPLRWFQRKHIVGEITVVNSNIYSSQKESKFIEIIDTKNKK